MNKLHVVAIQDNYLKYLVEQIKQVFNDTVIISPTTVKDIQNKKISKNDIVLLSSDMITGLVKHVIPRETKQIVAKRDVNFMNTRTLLNLPKKQNILVVNDTRQNIDYLIKSLENTFFEHNYYPYNPSKSLYENYDYILIAGEKELIPSGVMNVIDIGRRVLSIDTIFELYKTLKLKISIEDLVRMYNKSLIMSSNDIFKDESVSTENFYNGKSIIKPYTFEDIIAENKQMKHSLYLARLFSKNKDIIHLIGEIGTGKSLLSQAIHNDLNYRNTPYFEIDCKSKPEEIIESEIFGVDSVGATKNGLLDFCKNGTLLIKNIDVLSYRLQKKLYNVIKNKFFVRVSSNNTVKTNVRIITSSSKPLDERKHSSSLYSLLNPFSIYIPPLSDRKEDLKSLINNIKQRLNKENLTFTNEVMHFFYDYNWPGNIRELYNVISYLSSLDDFLIDINSLPIYLRKQALESITENKILQSEYRDVVSKIEEHFFLGESIEILKLLLEGKKNYQTYGRMSLKRELQKINMNLTEQQLRLRLEHLNKLNLVSVRQGRGGTTISERGEKFLNTYFYIKKSKQYKPFI